MRKTLWVILFFLGVFFLLIFALVKKDQTKKEQAASFINFTESDFSFIIHNKEYFEGKIIIVFFNTNCDLCSYELEILKHRTYPEIDFLFCSVQHADTIIAFANRNSLHSEINLSFAKIDSALIIEKYKIKGYPSYVMYEDDSLLRYSPGLLTDLEIRRTFYN